MAKIVCADTRPQMGTIRAGVFPVPPYNPEAISVIVRENPQIPDKQARTELLEILENAATEKINLEEASIIVAGGLGLGSKEGFGLIRELAEVLNGSVGASRKVVEAGWISRGYQIGQTGKTVASQLYIACGISGALQHLVGMQSSSRIVAINADAKAPIFKVADYGIIGDLYEIIPLMVKEIQKRKGQE